MFCCIRRKNKKVIDPFKPDFGYGWYVLQCGHINWWPPASVGRRLWCKQCNNYSKVSSSSLYSRAVCITDLCHLGECAICLTRMTAWRHRVAVTSCGHYFHVRCLNKWSRAELKLNGRRTCPCCRQVLALVDLVKHYKSRCVNCQKPLCAGQQQLRFLPCKHSYHVSCLTAEERMCCPCLVKKQ